MSLMKTISQLAPAAWDSMSKDEQRKIAQFLASSARQRAKIDKPSTDGISWDLIGQLSPEAWGQLDADRQSAIVSWINDQPLH